MSDHGSLCFAALPLPDSQDRGGNEAGGVCACVCGGGGRPEVFAPPVSFIGSLRDGLHPLDTHKHTPLHTHTHTPVPVQTEQLYKHIHTSTLTHIC